ncbi:response regulator [Spirosoma endbachense]|uniref:Response regulatory domain-containing protein n=1 Tax=Spirosoma endbachense TaxID=2666025 RepID=A0A6P1W428_9BACT|nr:hypothetical protein [Spirosoma endbachense]QHW00212.1 hypothetical protein GJR95_36625 [Spirosoma endbachense]
MKSDNNWVALLDEDQDDFMILQQGINTWAPNLELYWFKSFTQFEQQLQTDRNLPSSIVLNGISPTGSEIDWIKRFKLDSRLAEIPIIILTEEYWETQNQLYRSVGVFDYQTKPVSQNDLKHFIGRISDSINV